MRSAKGCVYEVSKGVWRVQVEGSRNPVTGARTRKTETVRGSRKQAEAVKARMLVEVGDTPDTPMTLDAFTEAIYFPDCAERLREVTVHGYRQKYAQYIREPLGGCQLDAIAPSVVTALLNTIESDTGRYEAFKCLRQILSKAVRLDMCQSNPCERVDPPRKRRYRPDVLSAEEARVYIEHYKDTPIEAAVLIALSCGLRRSEIAALDWDDIRDGKVHVTKASVSVGGRAVTDDTKTEFSYRSVAIPPKALARLEELRGEGAVLKDSNGNRLHPDTITKIYTSLQKTLPEGIKRIPLKNLRHTSLTLALEGGADLLAVSRRAGHSGVGITARYYLRPSDSIDKAAASALDSLF